MVSSTRFEFLFGFPFFFSYRQLVAACGCVIVRQLIYSLVFFVDDSDGRKISIKQRRHIESHFVSILHKIWDFRYSRHLRIINCVNLEPFILAINLNVVSSSNVFSTLVSQYTTKFLFSKEKKSNPIL